MNSVQALLKEGLGEISDGKISISPNINEKKLNNAVAKFGDDIACETVVALYDFSLLGDGKEGILFLGTKLIYLEWQRNPIVVDYEKISKVRCEESIVDKDKDKTSANKVIYIDLEDGSTVELKRPSKCNFTALVSTLTKIVDFDGEFLEASQIVAIQDMDERVKLSYVKLIVNMAFSDDNQVDAKEYSEILLLITRLNFNSEQRIKLRAYITNNSELESNEQLVEQLNKFCPNGNELSLHISLTKDILNIHAASKNGDLTSCHFIDDNRNILRVTDEQIELARKAIETDRKLLSDSVSDKELVKSLKELAASAGAVGVPLAAVYMSGSVAGIGAAGITSGLATLGFGGVLGFSGMVTGIGVAVLLGIGVYKGIKHLSDGANRNYKKKELMLLEVQKVIQKTINDLISDINYIGEKLNAALADGIKNRQQIKKLTSALTLLSKTGKTLTTKSNNYEIQELILKCPKYLNLTNLKNLTLEPTKAKYYDIVLAAYEEQQISEDIDSELLDGEDALDEKSKTKWVLRKGLEHTALKDLVDIFDAIGYFQLGKIANSAVKGMGESTIDTLNKAKSRFASLGRK